MNHPEPSLNHHAMKYLHLLLQKGTHISYYVISSPNDQRAGLNILKIKDVMRDDSMEEATFFV